MRNSGTKTASSVIATGGTKIYSNTVTILAVSNFNNSSGTTTLSADVGSGVTVSFNFTTLTGAGDFVVSSTNGSPTGNGRIVDLTVGNGSGFTGDIGWSVDNYVTLRFGNNATFGGSLTAPSTGRITLDHDVTFASVTLDGGSTFLSAGTHSFSELNAAYDAIFNENGTGSITVVPEPATMALFALGGLLLAKRNRTA
jgi:hypothetical protein